MIRSVLLLAVFVSIGRGTALAQILPSYVPSDVNFWYPLDQHVRNIVWSWSDGIDESSGPAQDRFGNPRGAYRLNGIYDYIYFPFSQIGFSTGFTVSIWVRPEAVKNAVIFGKMEKCPDRRGFRIATGENGEFLAQTGCREDILTAATTVTYSPGQWYHVAASLGIDDTLRIYVNGVLAGVEQGGEPAQLYDYFTLGRDTVDVWNFNGFVDEIGIWVRPLDPQEIYSLYAGGLCTPASRPDYMPGSGLIGWWPFQCDASDRSGNGFDAAVVGPTLSTDRFGHQNGAYTFDGIDDYMVLPDLGQMENFTLSAWVNADELPGPDEYRSILGKFGSWGNGDFHWHFFDTLITFAVWLESPYLYVKNNFIQPQSWHHLLVAYEKGLNTRLYVDGRLVGEKVYAKTIDFAGMRIGSEFDGRYWKGKIDDVAIWDRVLTEQEIRALYQSGSCKLISAVRLQAEEGTPEQWFTGQTGDSISIHPSQLANFWLSNGSCTCTDAVMLTGRPELVHDTLTILDTLTTEIYVPDTLCVQVMTTSTGEAGRDLLIRIYPNPASRSLFIDSGSDEAFNGCAVLITNQRGAPVFSARMEQGRMELDPSRWSGPGLYVVAIIDRSGNPIARKKIIIQ